MVFCQDITVAKAFPAIFNTILIILCSNDKMRVGVYLVNYSVVINNVDYVLGRHHELPGKNIQDKRFQAFPRQ